MFQWGHWPEVWEGGPVLGGQHQAQIVKGEVEVVDRIIEEGQSLTIGGRLVPIRSEMKVVKFPETEDERKMRYTRSGQRPALQGIPWLKN
jgi:hypothetical protein